MVAVDLLELERLAPSTTLLVRTANSLYRVVIIEGSRVSLQGGTFFPDPTPAHVEGVNDAPRYAVHGVLAVGMAMGVRVSGRSFTTSLVRSITVEPATT